MCRNSDGEAMKNITLQEAKQMALEPIFKAIKKAYLKYAIAANQRTASAIKKNIDSENQALAFVHRQQINLKSELADLK